MVSNHSWGLKIISANKFSNISTPFPLIGTLLKTVLKVMWDSIGLTLFFHVICPKKLPHPLSQSDSKLKPTATWFLALSYTSNSLLVYTLISDGLPLIFYFALIGCSS